MRLAVAALIALPLLTTAVSCASDRVTWADAEPSVAGAARASARRSAAPQHDAGEAGPSAGLRIDRALRAFVSTRVESKQHPKTSRVWASAWDTVIDEVGEACQTPPRASDLGAFVRARATLEVELDIDRRRGVLLPDGIGRRLTAALKAVDESVGELRQANAPGTMAPVPRLDGELVLRAPLSPLILSSPFGVRSDPFSGQRRFHAGADFDAPEGSNVYAAASGLVVYAGAQGGYGKQVIVDHGDGVRTHYSHLAEILVQPMQAVDEGDPVGAVGSTGRSTGPHLHFAVTNFEGEFLDPIALLDVPYTLIAEQVKSGGKSRQAFTVRKRGDTVEFLSAK
ncbi:MAG: hypothetical protein A2138_16560 [Deltaproteobacteria bacterium RBG_16_71_12]|nr:MAG: hypothetical protein A2138_16560 [Deltaproteobacteria bacterium RBG_16_71_12]